MNFEMIKNKLGVKEEFEIPPKLLNKLLSEDKNKFLKEIKETIPDLKEDFLRDYYSQNMANKSTLKQEYTPASICNLISKLYNSDEILDICAGTGSLSITDYNENKKYYLEEVSKQVIPFLILNFAIRNLNAEIREKDIVTNEVKQVYILTKSEEFSDIKVTSEETKKDTYEIVLSNPPYSLKWDSKEDKRLEGYDIPPKNCADYLFLIDGLLRTKEKAFYILPHGILFRGSREGNIREKLLKQNYIETIIGLPSKMFMNTGIPTAIIILNKNKPDNKILFIDASKEFKKEGKYNHFTDEHIEKIAKTYKERSTIDKFSNLVDFNEIEENQYNLNIPRYVDTWEDEPVPDLEETIAEIIKIDEECNKLINEMLNTSKQLYGTNKEMDDFYKMAMKPLYDLQERDKNGTLGN